MDYRDEKGNTFSPVYLKTLHNQLSCLFNHAVKYYGLRENPAAKAGNMGKAKGREMLFWTKEEYLKFAEAMMDKPLSYYAFEMLYWCGIREGELLALTPADFDFEKGAATICVKAEVRNESGAQVKAKLVVKAREAGTTGTIGTDGTAGTKSPVAAVPPSPSKIFLTAVESDVYEASPAPTRVASPDTTILSTEIRASGLVFWSPDTPHLYDVVVSLVDEKGDVLDSETIRTGFREVKYDAKSGGLKINGKNTWLTGYAQRATDEWAAIGVAPDWLQDYDAALIRKSNANFVRWMHVAPKPAPVRAFDKFGIVNVAP